MRILIILESTFYSNKQNQYCYDNMIELDWELPFLPNNKDFFDCDSILEDKMPDFYEALSWSVESINYEKIDGKITPILWLIGE